MTLPDHLVVLRDEALQTSCESWAIRARWKLAPGIDRAGPCPNCGGTDRFWIHTRKNTFNCRRCGIAGEGVIKLVMLTQNVEFIPACEIITGRKADAPVDPARAARLAEEQRKAEAQREREAAAYREKARKDGYQIWRGCRPKEDRQSVIDYLDRRGLLTPVMFDRLDAVMLREHCLPYMAQRADKSWVSAHEGPVMVAAVQMPDGRFGAAHQTWIDLAQDKGKALIFHPETGEALPAKKVRGTKKGGAIRLYSTPDARRILMGEGVETTLTAFAHNFEEATNYWAGVDLGNMSGKALRDADGKRREDLPDLDDVECFLPPDWCEELVYLGETDDPEKHTTEKVIRGLLRAQILRRRARAENPSLPDLEVGFIEGPEAAGDLNELVRVHVS